MWCLGVTGEMGAARTQPESWSRRLLRYTLRLGGIGAIGAAWFYAPFLSVPDCGERTTTLTLAELAVSLSPVICGLFPDPSSGLMALFKLPSVGLILIIDLLLYVGSWVVLVVLSIYGLPFALLGVPYLSLTLFPLAVILVVLFVPVFGFGTFYTLEYGFGLYVLGITAGWVELRLSTGEPFFWTGTDEDSQDTETNWIPLACLFMLYAWVPMTIFWAPSVKPSVAAYESTLQLALDLAHVGVWLGFLIVGGGGTWFYINVVYGQVPTPKGVGLSVDSRSGHRWPAKTRRSRSASLTSGRPDSSPVQNQT
jgi:hypothetical protein